MRRNKRGQTLVEYALIPAFISVVAIGVLLALGVNGTGVFGAETSQLSHAGGSGSGSGPQPLIQASPIPLSPDARITARALGLRLP